MLNLDIKKVKFDAQHNGMYQIFYSIDSIIGNKFPEYKKWEKTSCYHDFFNKRRKDKEADQVFTTFQIHATSLELTKENVIDWVNLCKKNKFLPEYVVTKDCFKEEKKVIRCFLTINFTDLYQSTLYLYLDTFRKLREDQGFVKSILYLCNKKGMDFCTAYILASHFNITAIGHHSVPVDTTIYTSYNNPKPADMKGELNLKMVRSLYKFVNDDKIKKGKLVVNAATSWHCNKLINQITDNNMVVPIKYLNDPTVVAVVHEFDCNKAVKLLAKFLRSKPKKEENGKQ